MFPLPCFGRSHSLRLPAETNPIRQYVPLPFYTRMAKHANWSALFFATRELGFCSTREQEGDDVGDLFSL